ncbi:MAG: peptidase S8 [Sphingomonadales bacterium]|nr:MAG: peptidase S8 [Sphingomonadales bacterium]
MNALVAYNRGGTGSGIRVGVIDSGIDLQSAEFGDCSGGVGTGTCRIASQSQSTGGGATVDDEDGHGTAVAFTIAGRRNDAGTHGVAFDAQLIIARADSPGSCAGDGEDDECSFSDGAIAQGLDAARLGGARVVNMSLGGSAPNSVLLQAIDRATQAGVVIVISAGNDGPDAPNPDDFAAPANDPGVSRGLIIIAGSVDASDTISTFSNRAGTSQQVYLAALGERVRAPDHENTSFLWSGTSFSAPQIAGAVALLAQAFPNLTGAQIVQLLLTTARDVGAAGTDSIYGRGVLDLTRAFQPVGTTSLAGSRAPTSDNFNAALSAPMGDAAQGALGVVILDGFDRAFATDLARTIQRDGPARQLPQLMASRQRSFSVGLNDMNVAVSLVPTHDSVQIERLGIGSSNAGRARMLAGSVVARLGSRAQFAIGASEGVNTLSARLAGRPEPAFLIARDPTHNSGFDVDVKGSAAVRRQFGAWGVTLGEEAGEVLTRRDTQFAALRRRAERFGYMRSTLGIDRRFGGLRTGLNLTHLSESDTLLGARFSGALGATRADSVFLDLVARYDMGGGWSLGGSMRHGWTQARLRGGVGGSGMVRTNAFAANLARTGLLVANDSFGIRVAQPLRVSAGALDLRLPGGWDYYSQSVDRWNLTRFNLAPTGREVDFELAFA